MTRVNTSRTRQQSCGGTRCPKPCVIPMRTGKRLLLDCCRGQPNFRRPAHPSGPVQPDLPMMAVVSVLFSQKDLTRTSPAKRGEVRVKSFWLNKTLTTGIIGKKDLT